MKRFFCLLLLLTLTQYSLAQTPASALTVSPVIIEATIAPGKSDTRKLTVKNETEYFIPVKVAPKSWEAEDLTGSAIPLEPEPRSAAGWIKLSETDFILEPLESKRIELRVRVPKNAPPGGHYPALSVRPVVPEYLAPGVAVETEIIALLFITVKGKIVREAEIESFEVDRRLFYEGEPSFSLILKNLGNVHIKATGPITLYGPFGRLRASWFNRPAARGYVPGPLTVLPGVRRLFKFSAPRPFWPGKYRAVVDLTLEDGQTLSASGGFWYIPNLIPVFFSLLLLALTVGGFRARKRLIPAVRVLLKGRT